MNKDFDWEDPAIDALDYDKNDLMQQVNQIPSKKTIKKLINNNVKAAMRDVWSSTDVHFMNSRPGYLFLSTDYEIASQVSNMKAKEIWLLTLVRKELKGADAEEVDYLEDLLSVFVEATIMLRDKVETLKKVSQKEISNAEEDLCQSSEGAPR